MFFHLRGLGVDLHRVNKENIKLKTDIRKLKTNITQLKIELRKQKSESKVQLKDIYSFKSVGG